MFSIKLKKVFFLALISSFFLVYGCKDDDDMNTSDSKTVQEVLALANEAIHSSGSLNGLETFSYANTAQRFVAGEATTVGDVALSSDITTSVNIDDLNNNLIANYQKSFYILGGSVDFTEIIQNNLGYIDGVDGIFDVSEPDMLSDRVGSAKRFFLYTNPQFLIKKASTDESSLSLGPDSQVNGRTHYTLNYVDNYGTFNIFIDQSSGQINRIQTIDYDYLFGDVVLEVNYSNYNTVSDYSLAENISIVYDGHTVYEETRTNIQANPIFATTQFDFPAGANPVYNATDFERGAKMSNFHQAWLGIGAPRDGREATITATEFSSNVFSLRNHRYNSLVIIQENSVAVVEPNLYPEVSEGVMDWIAMNYPDKPVKHIISIHHHTDHFDGIRPYVAQGAEVVTSSLVEDYLTRVFNSTHTIFDDYQINDFDINLVPEGDQITLTDDNTPIELYHVGGSHSEDNLLLYLPNEKLIFATDSYPIGFFDTSIPLPPFIKPAATELYNNLVNLGFTNGNSLASGHGFGTITFEDFEAHVNL